MRMLPPLIVVAALALLGWPTATTAAPPDPHASAKAIYATSCASCHGDDLRGGGASSLADGLWLHGSGEQIPRSIAVGVAEAGMPAFGDTLSRKDIRQLVAYMQQVEHEADLPDPVLPELIPTRDYNLRVTPIAQGLNVPWAIAFFNNTPDNPHHADTALITERGGTLRLLTRNGLHPDPIRDTPTVIAVGKSGLLDVAIDPNYADNRWVYLGYCHRLPNHAGKKPRAMLRVVRGRIRDHTWVDQQVVWEALPEQYSRSLHLFGSRLAFGPDGNLYFSVGDMSSEELAQDVNYPNGKIHRVAPDGTIPADNPFADRQGACHSVYSYGHRNPQGLATHPVTGQLWETEHGPRGGDELNLIAPGNNYGWPVISYGINYNGTLFTDITAQEGMQQPVIYWKPSIATCGMSFYTGDQFPRWKNNLFVGGLSYETLQRLVIVDDRVIYKEEILKNLGRVRDVQEGPDGALYIVLNNPGTVLRLSHDATHTGAGDGDGDGDGDGNDPEVTE